MTIYKTLVGEIQAVYKTPTTPKVKITGSQDSHDQLVKIFDPNTIELREEMVMLLLNRANNTLGWVKVSQGGLSGTICDPKTIFSHALLANAAGIILAHNHPSGNLQPSTADSNLTRKVRDGAKLLDIVLLDHLILTRDGYFSFADKGIL